MEIINPSDNVLDLGIFMSSNCSFEFHIQNLCKKCKLDCYLKIIVDLPGRPGFSNNLDSGDILQWWTPCEDLASN